MLIMNKKMCVWKYGKIFIKSKSKYKIDIWMKNKELLYASSKNNKKWIEVYL